MKLSNKLPLIVLFSVGTLSQPVLANSSLFTAMDDPATAKKPFEGSAAAGYQAQSGNTKNSTLTGQGSATWFDSDIAYSLWGNAANKTSASKRSSEIYNLGGRARHNLTSNDYLFGQASWLNDRYNGLNSRDVATLGYGNQILSGPIHALRVEAGPSVRYDDYRGGGHKTRAMGYAAASYQWQLTENTKFIQAVSVLSDFKDGTTVDSETGLQVAINEQFGLKLAYNVTWNETTPVLAPKHTDTRSAVMLTYAI